MAMMAKGTLLSNESGSPGISKLSSSFTGGNLTFTIEWTLFIYILSLVASLPTLVAFMLTWQYIKQTSH